MKSAPCERQARLAIGPCRGLLEGSVALLSTQRGRAFEPFAVLEFRNPFFSSSCTPWKEAATQTAAGDSSGRRPSLWQQQQQQQQQHTLCESPRCAPRTPLVLPTQPTPRLTMALH